MHKNDVPFECKNNSPEDDNEVDDKPCDEDTRSVICKSDIDSDNCDSDCSTSVQKSTTWAVLNKTVKRNPDRTEEEIRDSHIVYSEDLN